MILAVAMKSCKSSHAMINAVWASNAFASQKKWFYGQTLSVFSIECERHVCRKVSCCCYVLLLRALVDVSVEPTVSFPFSTREESLGSDIIAWCL
jgi:hypothetical protein